jgi:hypothetical protein
MDDIFEPIHVTVSGSPDDPRLADPPPGVIVHYSPPLHPDDLAVIDGLPVTSPSRTLIDLAEDMDEAELWNCFARFRNMGLLDMHAVHASRSRVEWRPSLAMLDRVIADFDRRGG